MFVQKQVPVKAKTGEKGEAAKQAGTGIKTETSWQVAGDKQVDTSGLNHLLDTLSGLSCQKYLTDKKKEDFSKPVYSVLLKGNKDYFLMVYAKTDPKAQDYPAVSSANAQPFLLSGWLAEDLMRNYEKMLGLKKESHEQLQSKSPKKKTQGEALRKRSQGGR